MKKSMIEIEIHDGRATVPAYLFGPLAVHPCWEDRNASASHAREWRVSVARNGLAFPGYYTFKQAVALAKALVASADDRKFWETTTVTRDGWSKKTDERRAKAKYVAAKALAGVPS